jgi:MOSC domain-containing protein YiiM
MRRPGQPKLGSEPSTAEESGFAIGIAGANSVMPIILIAINVSAGGVPKTPVHEAFISYTGVAGDRQRNQKWHGGADRAVSLLAMSVIRELQAAGHPIGPGSTGENLTLEGCTPETLYPGRRLRINGVTLELTTWLEPCSTIGASFTQRRFKALQHEHHPCRSRIGARVLVPGLVRTGDAVEALDLDLGLAPRA